MKVASPVSKGRIGRRLPVRPQPKAWLMAACLDMQRFLEAAENPQAADLLEILWNEFVAANRSATFWQQICDVEKELSERMAQTNVQLKQEYLRLIQEQ